MLTSVIFSTLTALTNPSVDNVEEHTADNLIIQEVGKGHRGVRIGKGHRGVRIGKGHRGVRIDFDNPELRAGKGHRGVRIDFESE